MRGGTINGICNSSSGSSSSSVEGGVASLVIEVIVVGTSRTCNDYPI